MRKAILFLFISMTLVAATPTSFGGWAVVTFADFPEHLTVDRPTTFTFKLRQHGQTIRTDVTPSLSLRETDDSWLRRVFKRENDLEARYIGHGSYEATITPRTPGWFKVAVDTDIHGWTTETLPVAVLEADANPVRLSQHDRGQQLFVAKGCATCHAKMDDPSLSDIRLIRVGPDLTGRVFDDDWLALKLADPVSYRMTVVPDVQMPALTLSSSEISSLVQYINGSKIHHTSTGFQPMR